MAEALNPADDKDNYKRPYRLKLLLDMPRASFLVQLRHSWNPKDASPNVGVKSNDKLAFYRYPSLMTTDAIRGKEGYTKGLHVWEIIWDTRNRGAYAVVGVATSEAPLVCEGHRKLVGSTYDSWGWSINSSELYHDGVIEKYPKFLRNGEKMIVARTITVILDMDHGTLSFMVNGCYLGIAFRGLKGLKLYPIVSTVWGCYDVSLIYVNGLERSTSKNSEGKKQGRGRRRILLLTEQC